MNLTQEQRRTVNEFIASKKGWRPPDHPDTQARTQGYCMPEKWWMDPSGELQFRHNIPDYCASLDVCHKAEKALFKSGDDWDNYVACMEDVCGVTEMDDNATDPIFSTAEQRALAMFQTLGGQL